MAAKKAEVIFVGDAASLVRASRTASEAVGKSERSIKSSSGSISSSFASSAKSAAKFAATSIGITGVGVALTKIGGNTIDFDKSMRNVNSIAQVSEKSLKSLEGQVLSLAGKTAQAPKTLADGLYDLVSSGFNAKQSMVILAASAKAATAGLTTTEVSTKGVAAVLNAYHRPAKDAADVSDVLFQTVNRGVITFDTLASNIGTVLPFAASLGVSLNQVGASISTMTKQGISGELSITFLKNAMVSFLKPSDGMIAAIKATGFASGEALIKAKGFQGALETVGATTDGTKSAMAKLFPSIRSLSAALALTGKNAGSAAQDVAAFKNVNGATDTALSQQSKSISYQWNKIKAEVSAASIKMGFAIIGAVSSARDAISQFAAKNKASLAQISTALRTVGSVAKTVFQDVLAPSARLGMRAVDQSLSGILKVAGGVTSFFSSVFTGQWRKAWDAVKTITSGATRALVGAINAMLAPFRTSAAALGHAIISGITSGIKAGAGAIASALSGLIPGPLKSILGKVGSAGGSVLHALGLSTGGKVPGSGAGDHVPALLEPGEFVIRKAVVDKFGPTVFANINGGMGSGGQRYASGGMVGRSGLIRLWEQAGGPASAANIAAAVALAESGGNPNASNNNTDGSIDRGLWQINSVHGAQSVFGALANARSAVQISSGGSNWHPWVTYNTGAYLKFLGGAVTGKAADVVSGGGGSSASPPAQTPHLEHQGSRLVNKISAPFFKDGPSSLGMGPLKGLSRRITNVPDPGIHSLSSLSGRLGASVDQGDVLFGQADRRFGIADAAAGRDSHSVPELTALLKMKKQQEARRRKRLAAVKGEIAKYSKLINAINRKLTGKNRIKGVEAAKIRERRQAYDNALTDLRAEALSLGNDIQDTVLDEGDLINDISAANAPAPADSSGSSSSSSSGSGAGGNAGGSSDMSAVVVAIQENTAAIQAQMRQADAVMATENFTLVKGLADVLSGHIVGSGVAGRALTAGAGSAATY